MGHSHLNAAVDSLLHMQDADRQPVATVCDCDSRSEAETAAWTASVVGSNTECLLARGEYMQQCFTERLTCMVLGSAV